MMRIFSWALSFLLIATTAGIVLHGMQLRSTLGTQQVDAVAAYRAKLAADAVTKEARIHRFDAAIKSYDEALERFDPGALASQVQAAQKRLGEIRQKDADLVEEIADLRARLGPGEEAAP